MNIKLLFVRIWLHLYWARRRVAVVLLHMCNKVVDVKKVVHVLFKYTGKKVINKELFRNTCVRRL